jgi:cell division protein FtsB
MRPLILILAVVFTWMQYLLWVAPDGLRELRALEAELADQSERNAAWAERNNALEAEVRDLRQGQAAAEERARAELGMLSEDETFFQIVSLKNGN